jgi:Phosphotransferase enzyme family
MTTGGTDELWTRAALRIERARGWALRPVVRLGRPRVGRRTWLAEGAAGTVIVKANANPFAAARAAWVVEALSVLAARGYPVPEILWHGTLDARWWLVVQSRLPGEPLRTLDRSALDQVLALVERQAEPGLGVEGGWDVSWWISVILFEGWEGWWDAATAAASATSRRLRAFLRPVWGHRLPVADVVHGDLNLSNLLARGGAISGVVDWDDTGLGTRAADLAGPLFDWYRLRVAGDSTLAPDGGDRLVRRIVEIAGDEGLRCAVGYAAVARLGLTAQRRQQDDLATWRRVTDTVLDVLG